MSQFCTMVEKKVPISCQFAVFILFETTYLLWFRYKSWYLSWIKGVVLFKYLNKRVFLFMFYSFSVTQFSQVIPDIVLYLYFLIVNLINFFFEVIKWCLRALHCIILLLFRLFCVLFLQTSRSIWFKVICVICALGNIINSTRSSHSL